MSSFISPNGFLLGAWQWNNDSPPKKIYPSLVKKKNILEKCFDVSMSGKSAELEGVSPNKFLEMLATGRFPSTALVRMRPTTGGPGNGFLIRNLTIEVELERELARLRSL
ncbi:hypothetical protein [Candidatus Thiodictyon syntrophicum]|uniref:hypothetical protein n=1 Tax=Candidatus Thiodictyon syntrophicum TaxID=1166950 RepID=UPI0012FD7E19|nr:hypothetical protein [Candidatus Thiodictyon syntrophicum]